MAALLVPACPIAKKRTEKRPREEVGAATADAPTTAGDKTGEIAAFGAKVGKGKKSGVQLRYHTPAEYNALSSEEREELHEWRKTNGMSGKKKGGGDGGPKKTPKGDKADGNLSARAVEGLVAKGIEKKLKELQKEEEKEQEAESLIASVVKRVTAPSTPKSGIATSKNVSFAERPQPNYQDLLRRIINKKGA